MLESLEIDFMGVSIDSLMVMCNETVADEVVKAINRSGVKADIVGWVEKGKGAFSVDDGKTKPLKPRFRESAYTPIKKLVGEEKPEDFDEMRKSIDRAFNAALEKKRRVVEMLRRKIPVG